jgi:hypothetical protein
MPKSAELRAEAARLRAIAVGVTETEVLTELQTLIAKLERRAREHDNGSADEPELHGGPSHWWRASHGWFPAALARALSSTWEESAREIGIDVATTRTPPAAKKTISGGVVGWLGKDHRPGLSPQRAARYCRVLGIFRSYPHLLSRRIKLEPTD